METKYTKGILKYSIPAESIIGGKKMYCCNIASENREFIATVYGSTKIECEANVKLFISAPEMYKWCIDRLIAMRKIKDAGFLADDAIEEYNELLAIKQATE